MTQNRSLAIRLILTLLFFAVMYFIVANVALSSFRAMVVQLESDHVDRLVVYFRHSKRANYDQERISVSREFRAGREVRAVVDMNNHPSRYIRFDPGDKPGHMKIRRIEFDTHFGAPIVMEAEEIFARFRPGKTIENYQLVDSRVQFDVVGEDPNLFLKGELAVDNPVLGNQFLDRSVFSLFGHGSRG